MPENKLIFFLLLVISQSVIADVVYFTNGDRISGKIISMQNNELKFVTAYAEIKIPWQDIKNIQSDEPFAFKFADQSQLTGKLVITDGESGLINPNISIPVPIILNEIYAINPPDPSDDLAVKGSIHLGGSKASGNTDNQSIHADAEIIAKRGNNKLTAGAEYNQDADNGQESSNNLHAYSQYDYYYLPDWYASLFAEFSKDRFQDLNARTSFGVSLGHEFWNSDLSYFDLEFGVAYTIENYNTAEDREFISGRWAMDFHYWLIQDRLQFFHNHEGLLSFEFLDDFLVRTHSGFKLPIFRGFELLTQIDVDYDNKPANGTTSTDTRYIVGIGYSW